MKNSFKVPNRGLYTNRRIFYVKPVGGYTFNENSVYGSCKYLPCWENVYINSVRGSGMTMKALTPVIELKRIQA